MSGDAALHLLRDAILERVGYHYGELHLPLLRDRLEQRRQELQLPNLLDYYYYLVYDSESGEEWSRLYSQLVVPETYFCRELEALRVAAEQLLPAGPGPFRVWHAGCSSGEEPYTMAMLLRAAGRLDSVELLATDLDEPSLLRARQAVYSGRSLRALAPDWLEREFEARPDGRYAVSSGLRSRVRFQKLNLVDREAVRSLPPCDLIVCRNVFIYFNPQTTERVVTDMVRVLRPGGHLLIGVCESLLRVTTALQMTQTRGVISYQKASA